MKKYIKKNLPLFIIFAFSLLSAVFFSEIGEKQLQFSTRNLLNFLFILVPVFICVGLLDIWLSKEQMIAMMGDKAGAKGILIAFLLGVVTAVPLYALLPIAGIMLKKRSKLSNVLVFICSSTSIRIPLLMFEAASFGWKFTLVRFAANIIVVLIIAVLIEKILSQKESEDIYTNADKL